MFIGHYATAFVLKKKCHEIPLWMLFLSVQLPNIVMLLFVLLGVRQIGCCLYPFSSMQTAFTYAPFSHSLLTNTIIAFAFNAIIALALFLILWKFKNKVWGLVLSIGVLSHWFLDSLVQVLGLWRYPWLASGFEVILLILAGCYIMKSSGTKMKYLVLMIPLLVAHFLVCFTPVQPSVTPVQMSIFSLGLYFIFTVLSYLGSSSFSYYLMRCRRVPYITRFNHDPIADIYDEEVHKALSGPAEVNYFRENYFEIQRRVIELAALQPGMKVLDIGIGTALMWADVTVSVDLHGVDISKRMLAMAAKKGISASLRSGHFLDLPYPPSSFDRIVSTFAFHHVPPEDKARAFEHMAQALAPDGCIVIGDLMFQNDTLRMDLVNRMRQEKRQDVISQIEKEYYTDIEALEASIAQLGLTLECQRGSTLSWIIKVTRSLCLSPEHSHNFVKQ